MDDSPRRALHVQCLAHSDLVTSKPVLAAGTWYPEYRYSWYQVPDTTGPDTPTLESGVHYYYKYMCM